MADPGKKPTEARIWPATISEGTCRSCHQHIFWAKLCKSGKNMPFDRLVTVREGRDDQTGVAFQVVSLVHTHWNSCPHAKQWSKTGGGVATAATQAGVSSAISELKQAQALLRAQYRETSSQHIVDAGQAIRRALTLLGGGTV